MLVVRGFIIVCQRAFVDVDTLVRRRGVVGGRLSNGGDVNLRLEVCVVADAPGQRVHLDPHDDAAADHRGRLGAVAVAAAEGDRGRVHVPLPAFGDGDVRHVARLGGGANRVVGAQGDHRLGAVARGAADGAAVEVPQVIRGSDELELVVGGSQPERRV